MPLFTYIDKSGKSQTTEAADAASALRSATNRDPASGVQLFTPPKPTAPNSAGDIRQSGSVRMPQTSPGYGSISSAVATTAGNKNYLDILKAYEDSALAREDARYNQNQKGLSSLLSMTRSPADARSSAQKETGIIPKEYYADQQRRIAEVDKLTEEYNKTTAQRDEALDKIDLNEGGALEIGLNAARAQIERTYAVKLNQMSANINSKSAVMEALQGNFNSAQSFVNQAVQDAIADNAYQVTLYKEFRDLNEESFNRLDDIYKTSFNAAMNLAEKDYDRAYKEKQDIGQLMIDNPDAGLSMSDSIETAYAKVQAAGGSLNARQEARLLAETTDPTAEQSPTGLIQQAIDSGMDPESAALDVAGYYESMGIQINESTISKWIKEARGLTKSPSSEPAQASVTKTPLISKRSIGNVFKPFFSYSTQNPYKDAKNFAGAAKSFFTSLFSD